MVSAADYDIHVGGGMLARAGELLKPLVAKAVGGLVPVVTDSHVAELHLPPVAGQLAQGRHRRPRHRDAAGRSQQKLCRA